MHQLPRGARQRIEELPERPKECQNKLEERVFHRTLGFLQPAALRRRLPLRLVL